MTFQELISRKRLNLQPCETVITLPSGEVLIESDIGNGECNSILVGTTTGFVVDTKPDLQVACIVPGLCMGSQDVIFSETLLEEHRISHILSLGIMPEVNINKVSHLYVPLLDVPEADIESAVEQSLIFIKEAIKAGGIVYVHCNAGISRSASIVIAYLIKEGMSFNDAYNLVKSKREIIKPNEGFVKYLKELEDRITKFRVQNDNTQN